MKAFVDTYALIAWLHAGDGDHTRVSDYMESFSGRLVTTEWILVEFADAFAAPAARRVAAEFLRDVGTDPRFEIVPAGGRHFQAGLDLYAARPDKGWSLTDCICFTVMTERNLADALTADRHFAQAGFRPVFNLPQQ